MTGFSAAVQEIIKSRAGNLCERCGNNLGVTAHHRLPLKAGGTKRGFVNLAANGLWVCPPCHRVIHANPAESYLNGWLVHDYPNGPLPSQASVLRRDRKVLLADDGSVSELPRSGGWGETHSLGEGLDDDWPISSVTF